LAGRCGQVAESAPVYRPRRPEASVFYQTLERHFDEYVWAYEGRFESSSGPLRPEVPKTVEAFLACGRPEGGFARIKCPDCKREMLLTFSCRTRQFCQSCQAKRSALFAEKLLTEILAPVAHRHYTFTVPRAIRGLFQRDRRFLGLLARSAYDALRISFERLFERSDVRPGCIISLQTLGSYGQFHPHAHCLVSEGVFTAEGEFLPLTTLDTKVIEELFRRLVLRRLHQAERLSTGFMERLSSWQPSGFSCHGEQVVGPDETVRLERLARYITRPAIALDSVSRLDDGRIRLSTPPHPQTGETQLTFDVLDWIHAVTMQIPRRRQHLTRHYGAYSCRSHSAPRPKPTPAPADSTPTAPESSQADDPTPFIKARRASWARLLKRVFEVDALLCPCGAVMSIVAFITDAETIEHILDHVRSTAPSLFEPSQNLEARAPPA
jgi:hypothetical protein